MRYVCTNPDCKPQDKSNHAEWHTDGQGMTYWRGIPQGDIWTCGNCGSRTVEVEDE